jgi:CRP-like cAMP-binding protein
VHDAGRRVETGVEIDFPVSRQDIAEMTGTTLFTVSRLLSGWEERGIVQSGRQRIVITRPHALVAIADDLPST